MKQIPDIKVADDNTDKALRDLRDAVRELQQAPAVSAVIVKNVELEDGVVTRIAHGLGRQPRFVTCSAIRESSAAGRIVEILEGVDRSKAIKLVAANYAQTIYVDVKVE